ncbi:MAG: RING finger protein [Aigarchaeota archaeon]|nr:RING finger protein [Aigarchaeota archaeon]MCX8192585.1 RING finger protein [Nitrososphaeria archaeon]MDW7985679.1 RING finger protein [Nitrososphaerota archaeon]
MIVTQEEVVSRFFKIGSSGAVVGALHILTLLLGWYIETDGEGVIALTGYNFMESFILSTVGGLVAGISLLIAYLVKKLNIMKAVIGGLLVSGGALALLSPIYIYLFKILAFNLRGYPDLGFFAAVFTAIIQLGIGVLVLLTPLKKEILIAEEAAAVERYPTPSIIEEVELGAPMRREIRRSSVASIVDAEDVEEGICMICYYPLTSETSVKCSACGALFHRDCIDAWVSLNRVCPNCKTLISH